MTNANHKPIFIHRNYSPTSEVLKQYILPPKTATDIESDINDRLNIVINKSLHSNEVSIVPRRPNWDVKRDWNLKQQNLLSKYERAREEIIKSLIEK